MKPKHLFDTNIFIPLVPGCGRNHAAPSRSSYDRESLGREKITRPKPFYVRSVHLVREHGNMAGTPLMAFFNRPLFTIGPFEPW